MMLVAAADPASAELLILKEGQLPEIVIVAISAVGGLLLVLNVVLVVFFVRRRRRLSKRAQLDSSGERQAARQALASAGFRIGRGHLGCRMSPGRVGDTC